MDIVGKIRNFIQGQGRSATVKKNMLASVCIKIVSIAVSFALVPLTIGYVSSELYGVWLTLSSIMTWVTFLDIGFAQGLKNKLTEAISCKDWSRGKSLVSTTYFMMILIFVPVCVVLEFVVPVVDWCSLLNVHPVYEVDIKRAMQVLIVVMGLQMILNVFVSVVAAFQKVALSNTFVPIGNLMSLVVILVLIKVVPPSLTVLSFTLAVMPVLVTLVASLFFYSSQYKTICPSFYAIRKSCVKDLFSLGYKFFVINVQVVVVFQSTNFLISNISSPNEVTTFNIAYKLLSVAMMFFSIVVAPLWPAYTDAYVREDYDWMKRTKAKMNKFLIASLIGCSFMVLLSPIIYHLWIGNKVSVPMAMTCLVALYVMTYCWRTLNGTLVMGMGKAKIQMINVTVGMIVHIPLSLFFSRYVGAYGIIISMLIINLFYAAMMHVQINKLLNQTADGIWRE